MWCGLAYRETAQGKPNAGTVTFLDKYVGETEMESQPKSEEESRLDRENSKHEGPGVFLT